MALSTQLHTMLAKDRADLLDRIADRVQNVLSEGGDLQTYLTTEFKNEFALAAEKAVKTAKKGPKHKTGYHLYQKVEAHKLLAEGYSTVWRDCFKEAAARWSALPPSFRVMWNEAAAEDKPAPNAAEVSDSEGSEAENKAQNNYWVKGICYYFSPLTT